MNVSRPVFLLCLGIFSMFCFVAGWAQDEAGKEAEATPEELKKAVEDYAEWWVAEVSKGYKKFEVEQLENHINKIKEAVELNSDQVKALKAVTDKAAESSFEPWKKAARKYMVNSWMDMPGLSMKRIEETKESVSKMTESSRKNWVGSVKVESGESSTDGAVWKTALEEVLTPNQLKTWNEKVVADAKELAIQIKAAVETYRSAQEPALRTEILKTVKALQSTIDLDEKRGDALAALVEKLIEAELKKISGDYRKRVEGLSESQQEMLFARRLSIATDGFGDPTSSEGWSAGIGEILTKEELKKWESAWEKFKTEEEEKFKKQANQVVKTRAAGMRDQQKNRMMTTVQDIVDTVGLEEKREKEIEALLKKSLDAYEAAWTEAANKYLKDLDDKNRRRMIESGYVYVDSGEESLPQNQKVWKEGLKKILSEDELAMWEQSANDREERRRLSFGNLVLMELDQIAWLSPKQREKLLPVLCEIGEERFLKNYRGRAFSMSSSTIYSIMRNDSDLEKVKEVLDDEQKERWTSWATERYNQYRSRTFERESKRPEPKTDKGYIQEAISMFLHDLIDRKRQDYLNYQMAQVEAIDRLIDLTDEQRKRLELAAKGNVENQIDKLAAERSDYIHRSVKNTSRNQIYSRLSQFTSMRFGTIAPEQREIWTNAVEKVLTPEQAKVLDEFNKGRTEFQTGVLTLQVLTHLEFALHLKTEQVEKLRPHLKEVLQKYAPELKRSFTSSTPWYFTSTYSLTPVAGIPEEVLKEVLTAKQHRLWQQSHLERIDSYWDRVIRYYEERMKLEKESGTGKES